VIDGARRGDVTENVPMVADCSYPGVADLPHGEEPRAAPRDDARRVQALAEEHFDFVWRTFRYLGLSEADAEDAAQEAMCVLARRIADVVPGSERPFLFSTATHIAATWRRTARRRPETADDDLDARASSGMSAEELLDERRAYEALQRVLQSMPVELRLVFVLYEIEELSAPAIAAMIGVPVGTVASRLRRAREAFHAIVKRTQTAQRGREARR
jgi:RNA polymerase sigma-70 factor (ECF subfamily)